MSEILDNFEENQSYHPKKRHGCVSAWLIFMVVINGIITLSYLAFSGVIADTLPNPNSQFIVWIIAGLSLLNVIFAIMLLQWKKLGFYGFVITSLASFIINLSLGVGILQSLLGLFGIAALYAILQIKSSEGMTAWDGLE